MDTPQCEPHRLMFAAADGGHADLVICARKETREGIGKGHLAARLQSHRDADHILLRDVALPKMIGIGFLEYFRECGILHVARDGHHLRIYRAHMLQRETVGFARRHFRIGGIVGCGRRGKIRRLRQGSTLVGLAGIGWNRPVPPPRSFNRLRELFFRKWLAMPVQFVGNQAKPVAFDRARNDCLRLALGRFRAIQSGQHGGHVVPVDDLRVQAFGLEFRR